MESVKNVKRKGSCRGCLFFGIDSGLEKCLRFARFVDHVIHDYSCACEYRASSGRFESGIEQGSGRG